jgi:hypothetical protein
MRIPRSLEWRAGAALVIAAMLMLVLAIVLTRTRTDVGVEVEGIFSRSRTGWTLAAEMAGQRLDLLRQCRIVRIRTGEGKTWYGRVSGISGQLTPEGAGVLARIEVREEGAPYTSLDSNQRVRAMLLRARGVPILNRPGM